MKTTTSKTKPTLVQSHLTMSNQ